MKKNNRKKIIEKNNRKKCYDFYYLFYMWHIVL